MNIRLATEADLSEVIDLYADYDAENTKPIADFDMEVTNDSIKNLIKEQSLMVAETADKLIGFVAGRFVPYEFSKEILFSVSFFYMKPIFRVYANVFLSKVEAILKFTPATKIVMASPRFEGCERLDQFYEKLGYEQLEVHYYKDLKRTEIPCPQI